jgi:hypothetical protein
MMGAPIQWTANIIEHMHQAEVKFGFDGMNYHNFEEQCTRILDWQEQVQLFDSICEFIVNGGPTFSSPVNAAAPENIITSWCPIQNFFLNGLVSLASLAAFHFNKTPDMVSSSIALTAHLYALLDFWPALP